MMIETRSIRVVLVDLPLVNQKTGPLALKAFRSLIGVSMQCKIQEQTVKKQAAGFGFERSAILNIRTGQNLSVPAAASINRDPFAAGSVREKKRLADLVQGGLFGEIDRLGDGVVGVLLECGLHPNMIFGGNVMRRYEEPSEVFGDFRIPLDGSLACNPGQEIFGVNTGCSRGLYKKRMDLNQL